MKNIKNTICARWYYFLFYYIVIVVCALANMKGLRQWQPDFSISDLYLCVIKGCQPFSIENPQDFRFPYIFLFAQILPFLSAAHGVGSEWKGYAKTHVCLYGSRSNWWRQKCFWNICNMFCFLTVFCFAIMTAAFFCQAAGMEVHIGALKYIEAQKFDITIKEVFLFGVLLRYLVMTAVSQAIMFLQIFCTEILSLILPITCLVMAAYKNVVWMLGCYLMAVRWDQIAADGVDCGKGIWISIVYILAFGIAGRIMIEKREIM